MTEIQEMDPKELYLSLIEQRGTLIKQLNEVLMELEEVAKENGFSFPRKTIDIYKTKKGRPLTPDEQENLHEHIMDILRGRILSIGDIVNELNESGYRTHLSANSFYAAVGRTLRQSKSIKRIERGIYTTIGTA